MKATNKNETKYQNTARLFDEALLLLLEKKEYPYITVKEICAKAGVNRSTFYLHYETMDDLLGECIDMITARFHEKFEESDAQFTGVANASKEDSFLITPKYLTPYLTFVAENKRVFSLIARKPELFDTAKVFNRMYKEIFSPILDKFDVPEKDKPYVFEYYSRGVMAIVMKWLSLDCNRPIDEIVALITDCLPKDSANKK